MIEDDLIELDLTSDEEEVATAIDYTDSFSVLHEDLIKVNNNLLVLSALLAILVSFLIVKNLFNRR